MKILLLDSGLGVICFIKEIILQNKCNDYYIYMDDEYFPYGNKTKLQLKKRLKFLFNKIEKLNVDLVCICCNTLSEIYLKNKYKTKFKVKTILSINLKHLENKSILVTPSLKKRYLKDHRFIKSKLASYIEKEDNSLMIDEIKNLKVDTSLILGCTHYTLIKHLFKFYLKNDILSYECEFIARLKLSSRLSFFVLSRQESIIKKYFPNMVIYSYSFS